MWNAGRKSRRSWPKSLPRSVNPARRVARRKLRLRIEPPRAAGQSPAPGDEHPALKLRQRLGGWDALDLSPVDPGMPLLRVKQAGVERGLVAEQQQPFAVRIEPTNGVNPGRETEFREQPVGRTIRRELGKNPVGFVEREQHEKNTVSAVFTGLKSM